MIPIIVGVTGKIASGKSTLVSNLLDRYFALKPTNLNCDELFKRHVRSNNAYKQMLRKLFRSMSREDIFTEQLEYKNEHIKWFKPTGWVDSINNYSFSDILVPMMVYVFFTDNLNKSGLPFYMVEAIEDWLKQNDHPNYKKN